jgi:hypothetical protein
MKIQEEKKVMREEKSLSTPTLCIFNHFPTEISHSEHFYLFLFIPCVMWLPITTQNNNMRTFFGAPNK